MAGGGPGSHGSTKQNYDLDQIWGDLREGIEHVSCKVKWEYRSQTGGFLGNYLRPFNGPP